MTLSVRAAVAPAIKPLAEATRLEIDAGLKTGDSRMHIMQSRRDFLTSASLAASASLLCTRASVADEAPPETPAIRLSFTTSICFAPMDVAEAFLRTEGFIDVRYVKAEGGFSAPQMVASGDVDFGASFGGSVVYQLHAGLPLTALAGLHAGCYELFAREPIRNVSDLKGRRVGIQTLASSAHLYLSIMATYVGLDAQQDIEWVVPPDGKAIDLFVAGGTDAFLGFPPEPQELRARGFDRVILRSVSDRPWSQYFCCMIYGNRAWVAEHPVATKRFLRAVFKAAEFCQADPEHAARRLVDRRFTQKYDYALQTVRDLPYDLWHEYDSEDSLRFYALRLHEAGMLRTSPNKILAEGTDWRFVNELKRELKA
jgi:NitT/TauT family transport system substrate-binding protein